MKGIVILRTDMTGAIPIHPRGVSCYETGDVICEQVRTIDLLARNCQIVERMPQDLLIRVLEAVSTIIGLEV